MPTIEPLPKLETVSKERLCLSYYGLPYELAEDEPLARTYLLPLTIAGVVLAAVLTGR